ncbi:hypothetical protein AV530_006248 [Patagioenas fasciata monilis]|uniref:Uncharacterized protein n=1 Tax=Patagioenas fasciata monilis TaxID=372326 RepID=A0A1V4KFX9_PATFA|nr:hypothetical protein AV530_006248 [Patagioenas fasciata monilis]
MSHPLLRVNREKKREYARQKEPSKERSLPPGYRVARRGLFPLLPSLVPGGTKGATAGRSRCSYCSLSNFSTCAAPWTCLNKSVLCMENQESLLWVTPILHLFFSMALTSLRYIRGKGEATEGRCELRGIVRATHPNTSKY